MFSFIFSVRLALLLCRCLQSGHAFSNPHHSKEERASGAQASRHRREDPGSWGQPLYEGGVPYGLVSLRDHRFWQPDPLGSPDPQRQNVSEAGSPQLSILFHSTKYKSPYLLDVPAAKQPCDVAHLSEVLAKE